MMNWILISLAVAGVSYVGAAAIDASNNADFHSKRDDDEKGTSCTSVLTVQQCESLLALVKNVVLPKSSIGDAITDVVSFQGLKTNKEIYKAVIKYLDARMLCDMILSPKSCKKLIAASLKYKMPYHEVDGYLQMLSLQNGMDKKVVFHKLMSFIKFKKFSADMLVEADSADEEKDRKFLDELIAGHRH